MSDVVGFAIVAGSMTLVPGIDTALVLRAAMASGRKEAYATVAGISLGLLVWAAVAAAGVSALVAASHTAYVALEVAGAAYLIWLGGRLLWQSRGGAGPAAVAGATWSGSGVRGSFLRGFLTNLLNPKIGVFYLAVLPQFLPEQAPAVGYGLLLAVVHVAEGVAWFSILILGTQLLRSRLQRPGVTAWIDRLTGTVLIAFGLRVLAARP